MDELLAAHERAQQMGLSWTDPVRHAIAERATGFEHVAEMVRAGR